MRIKKSSVVSEGVSLVILLALLTGARSSLADHYYVPSGSMEYALIPGDRVIVDKTAYGLRIPFTTIDLFGSRSPERGDVAVFDSPRDGTRLIKRIVAVGGDVVSVKDGLLTVNGKTVDRRRGPFEAVETIGDTEAILNLDRGGGPDLPPQRVPEGMVLALGDHRGSSLDGRYWGFVDETELYGKAVAVYYRRGEGFTWLPL
ncbi:MAG TPA: signal peptidase I [Gammaproteobacteria bacterium]